VRDFAILSGTSTNCAGGVRHPDVWLSCEEVVNASANGIKHGYIFEVDAQSHGPVPAVPVRQAGRRAHEAAAERGGIVYMTEDRRVTHDPVARRRLIGACFYRYRPLTNPSGPLSVTSGPLEALKIRNEFQANMNERRVVGKAYPADWVVIDEPDHDDDTDERHDRVRRYTPNRIQAQDKGAAFFNRLEGLWIGPDRGKVYFTATAGGPSGLGQVWQYDADREEISLIYESIDPDSLQNPDNITVVPATQDIFVCEDGSGTDYIRGVTTDGEIFDFLRTTDNTSELCGVCFDPDGHTLYVNQQGARGSLPHGPRDGGSVTYAVYGPFENRRRRASA
ncbi:MAG: alkaline phosphatase PhoX, partial [Thermoanaerobaculia bacterium]